LAGIVVASSFGMVLAILPPLGARFTGVWPWANTHYVLFGGLALSVVLLVVYLTMQQRKFTEIQGEVEQLEKDSVAREHRSKERLKALLNLSRMMGSVTDLENLFKYITDACVDLFGSQQVSLMLLNQETDLLEVRAATGHEKEDEVRVVTMKVGEGISGWVAKTRQPLLLGPGVDLSRYPGLNIAALDMTAAMIVPVLLRDEFVGVLNVRSRVPGIRYNLEDLQALQVFAENVGIVIRHSEHVEWMRKTIEHFRAGRSGTPVR
jgi:transcriptional regulator with GAF, ATPase, and Fis domain